MTQRVTSFDVARLAGVSQSTVSRALRNLPNITAQTRERVARAAAELRYVPHESGRTLSTRITGRVAVVSEALSNPFYPQLLEPLRERLGREGYRTVLVSDSEDDALTAAVLSDGSYDGVVITTAQRRSRLAVELRNRGVPCVLMNRRTDDDVDAACEFDNEDGARQVAELVLSLGHSEIALVAGFEKYSTGFDRERGFRRALDERGAWVPQRLTRHVQFSADDGRAAAIDLLSAPLPPTAIVCANDYIAFGVLNAARALGLRVPDDLTVIGFDDVAMASWDVLSLTTVRCDLDALGAHAVDMIIRMIRGERVETLRRVPVEMVLRGTHRRRETS